MKLFTFSVALIIIFSYSVRSQAYFYVIEHSAMSNIEKQVTTITITFSEVPDFHSVDEDSRQADSFQFFIDSEAFVPWRDFYHAYRGTADATTKTIVRGGEIHIDDDVRIREIVPFYSGGWGPLLCSVPYTTEGPTITFIVPLDLLKDTDGIFYYYLETYEFGATTGSTSGMATVRGDNAIPTLSEWGMIIFMSIIIGISVAMLYRRRGQ